jgi:hypothetical protein
VDERGSAVGEYSHVMDIGGAYPDMPGQRFELRLQNSGSRPTRFDLAVTDLQTTGQGSLDRVLVVTVRDDATDRVPYHGRLSSLTLTGPAITEPGSSAQYRVDVEWPNRGGDVNVYQGASLSFTVLATSHELPA